MKHILISAGEASGDLHAANLITNTLALNPQIEFYGMGGKLMQRAGAKILVDIKNLAIIGAFEIFLNLPKVFKMMRTMCRALKTVKPDLVVLVDYPGFNLWFAKIAKKRGIKVLYYISPQIWAWRQGRVKKIRKRIDMMAVVFPFEIDFYRKANIPVTFVGHPLTQTAHPTLPINIAKQKFSLDFSHKTIGLFPGSREGEIKRLLPVILNAAKLIQAQSPSIQFVLPLASSLKETEVERMINAHGHELPIKVVKNSNIYDVIQICDAIISTSGTVTLEIALFATPMVIVYKISPINYFIIRALNLIKIPYIGLPNIVAEEKIVLEFIQSAANANNIATEVNHILQDENYRLQMITKLSNIRQKLQSENAAKSIAELTLDNVR